MNTEEKELKDNELGIPMRLVAGVLAFFGWMFVFSVIADFDKYILNDFNVKSILSTFLLTCGIIIVTLGAVIGKVPKKITDNFSKALDDHEKQKKKKKQKQRK